MEAILITALIEKGGMWGIIAALCFFWTVYRENLRAAPVIPDKTDELKECQQKIIELNSLLAQKTEQISNINKERVDDLKELLEEYYKLVHDSNVAMEKIKIILETKRGR